MRSKEASCNAAETSGLRISDGLGMDTSPLLSQRFLHTDLNKSRPRPSFAFPLASLPEIQVSFPVTCSLFPIKFTFLRKESRSLCPLTSLPSLTTPRSRKIYIVHAERTLPEVCSQTVSSAQDGSSSTSFH